MSDESIRIKVGQGFSVPLKTFATAGYLWKIESMPDGLRVVETKKKKTEGETKPGDPTVQVLEFQALEQGEHTIVFVLSRPWEGQAMETRKVVVKADCSEFTNGKAISVSSHHLTYSWRRIFPMN